MRKHWLFASPFLALACVLAAPAAQAQTMNPFAKSEYHLGSGGTQVTIEQFAVDPGRYMRPGAYEALRRHIARQIGVLSLSDAEFKALLLSNRVRVVSCEGTVNTGGYRTNGTVGRLSRECYAGELRVLVQDSAGNWKSGFLLGCLNPDYTLVFVVRIDNPPPPAPPPVVIYQRQPPQPRIIQTYRPGYTVGGQVFQDCCCDSIYSTPTITIPGSTSTQTIY